MPHSNMKNKLLTMCRRTRLLLVIAVTSTVTGSLVTSWMNSAESESKRPKASLNINRQPLNRDGNIGVSFAPVIEEVSPSVVKIYTSSRNSGSRSRMPGGLERFFNEQMPGYPLPDRSQPRPGNGLGSGVIVSPEGYILTNHHVVEGSSEMRVVLNPNNEEYVARLVGADPKSDVAVLKIDADNLSPIEIGDSQQIMVGDIVLAIGNPFGVGQTVTMGMVSAKGRAQMGLDYEDFIQTDAAINPGNSGGALIDAKGRLVGINTAILSRSGGNIGIGFAIPVNLARNVMESIITNGRVVRGYLGVNIQDVNPAMRRFFDLESNQGAVIAEVIPESPAEAAGLRSGDVILEFDGHSIPDSRALKLKVSQCTPNRGYQLKLNRDGEELLIDVSLDELNEAAPQWSFKESRNQDSYAPAGMRFSELSPEVRREYRIPKDVQGLLVEAVMEDGAAWRAGIRPGCVLSEVNRVPLVSLEDLDAVDFSNSDKLLRIWCEGRTNYRIMQNKPLG
jgi:serine protease Do